MRRILLPLVVLMAGCLQPPMAETPAAPSPERLPTSPVRVSLDDCLQYHTQFTAVASDFASYVPPGFTIRTFGGDLFDLGIEFSRCEAAAAGSARPALALVLLPVEPPADLVRKGHRSLLPIEAYASDAALLEQLHAVGIRVAVPCRCDSRSIGTAALADEVHVQWTNGTYTLRPTLAPSSGAFGAGKNVLYLVQKRELTGVVLVSLSESQNRGLGPTSFQYSGPGAAPPLHGGVAHSVSGVGMVLAAAGPEPAAAS